jgi:hypothetical protein
MSAGAIRWLLVLLAASVATTLAAFAPRALRRMEAFHVQQVEVTGARYLSPQEAVAATGISPTSTVFDDFTVWRASMLRHPLVLDVQITRRLPFTLVLHVKETTPVAFALLPELRPVDARGRLLDIDPTKQPLDLPLLSAVRSRSTGSALTDPASLRALATLGRVIELEPALFALASEVAPLIDGVRLTLRRPAGAQLLLPDSPDAERLHLLRLTLADVAGAQPDTGGAPWSGGAASGRLRSGAESPPRRARAGDPPRLRWIDARYREQIVVALNRNESR